MINICIQNLGKYNEGELWFEWLELPATEEEINEVLDKIHICHTDENGNYVKYTDEFGNPYEEIHIPDWECDVPGLEYSEWWSIRELNEIAEKLDSLREHEYKHVCAYMEVTGCNLDNALDEYEERSIFWEDMDTSDVAREMADERMSCMVSNRDIEWLKQYFDYDAYERDLDLTEVKNGVIETW